MVAELRTRLTLAEERLSELKRCLRTCDVTAMLGANKRRRACYRHLRHRCHGGGGCVRPDEEAPMFTTTAVVLTVGIARWIEGSAQDVELVAYSSAVLIMLGIIADRLI